MIGTTMRHKARAKKWRIQSLGGTRRSPRRFHNWLIVLKPTVAMVNKPTHLQLTTAPREKPVSISHVHQLSLNGRRLSSLQKLTHTNVVREVKNNSGESS